jgi:hypothetical protein
MAVGAAVLVLRRENAISRQLGWTTVAGGAFGLVLLAALVAPPLLGTPAQAVLTGSERDVLVLVAVVVAGGALAVGALRGTAVITGPLILLVVANAPGADTALPLLVTAVVGVGALIVNAWTSGPVHARPHPLLRASLAAPVLVLIVVGAIFLPARTPELPHRQLASWLLASPGPALQTPPGLWADLVRDGVPADRLRFGASPVPDGTGWTIVGGDPGPGPRTAARLGSGTELVAILRPARESEQQVDVGRATPPSDNPSGSGSAMSSATKSAAPVAASAEAGRAARSGNELDGDRKAGGRAQHHDVPDRRPLGCGDVGNHGRDQRGHVPSRAHTR